MKILAILFAGTAGGVSSLIIRGWSSGREVMVVAVGIISFIVLGIALLTYFEIQKSIEMKTTVDEIVAAVGLLSE